MCVGSLGLVSILVVVLLLVVMIMLGVSSEVSVWLSARLSGVLFTDLVRWSSLRVLLRSRMCWRLCISLLCSLVLLLPLLLCRLVLAVKGRLCRTWLVS